MSARLAIGDRLPDVVLGMLVDGGVRSVSLAEKVAGKRVMIVGIPGAFTPVCTCDHVPDLVANADRLQAAGIDLIMCVAPDNPWALAAWAPQVDPAGRLLFLSDGNLTLARALGASMVDHRHFLGECSARYLLVAERGIVRRFTKEARFTDLTCTRAADALLVD